MAPLYRKPDAVTAAHQSAISEIHNALWAARCSARLAGTETAEFLVRELLLVTIQQIDRATAAVGRLC